MEVIEASQVKLSSLCPADVKCITDGTQVSMTFELPTCVDHLGPVTYKTTMSEDGRATLHVSALALINENSGRVRCRSYQQIVDVSIIDVKPSALSVEFLSNLANGD
jgi:hypothetical protein